MGVNDDLGHDYREQSGRYDQSRSASPSVLEPIRRALSGAPGRSLYDVGGGTGNYSAALSAEGWDPVVIDPSAEMRRQAGNKGLAVVQGNATALPAADDSADGVIMVSMLHQVSDWRTALDEAARVLRSEGCLAVMVLTADHLEKVTWAYDLFPSARAFALDRRPTFGQLAGYLPGAEALPMWFSDLADASIGALCAFPEAVLDEQARRQTSFFHRLERDSPAELASGLRQLNEMLGAGDDPRTGREEARSRLGDATILQWRSP